MTSARASIAVSAGTENRLEPFLRLESTDSGEGLGDDALLELDLGRVSEVLQRAATAAAEILAGRRDSIGGRVDDADELGFLEAPTAPARRDQHALGR